MNLGKNVMSVAIVSALTGGCAMTTPTRESAPSGAPQSQTSKSLATASNVQYIQVEAAQTGVLNAADDGETTFVAFSTHVPLDASVFDQDGKPLPSARSGPVMAVAGVHEGVLIRAGTGHSFVSPNRRMSTLDIPNIAGDPDVIRSKARLISDITFRPAMERALERARLMEAGKVTALSGVSSGPTTSQRGQQSNSQANAPLLIATAASTTQQTTKSDQTSDSARERSSRSTPAPKLAPFSVGHNDQGALVRLLYTPGATNFTRSEEALATLTTEALKAKEIRITGFTDGAEGGARNPSVARQRAETMRDMLIRRGIDGDRILVGSSSGKNQFMDNSTEQARTLNRRVDVLCVQ